MSFKKLFILSILVMSPSAFGQQFRNSDNSAASSDASGVLRLQPQDGVDPGRGGSPATAQDARVISAGATQPVVPGEIQQTAENSYPAYHIGIPIENGAMTLHHNLGQEVVQTTQYTPTHSIQSSYYYYVSPASPQYLNSYPQARSGFSGGNPAAAAGNQFYPIPLLSSGGKQIGYVPAVLFNNGAGLDGTGQSGLYNNPQNFRNPNSPQNYGQGYPQNSYPGGNAGYPQGSQGGAGNYPQDSSGQNGRGGNNQPYGGGDYNSPNGRGSQQNGRGGGGGGNNSQNNGGGGGQQNGRGGGGGGGGAFPQNGGNGQQFGGGNNGSQNGGGGGGGGQQGGQGGGGANYQQNGGGGSGGGQQRGGGGGGNYQQNGGGGGGGGGQQNGRGFNK